MQKLETEKKGTRTYDPELSAMAKVDRLLEKMDGAAARRVLAWLCAKYAPQANGQAPAGDAAYRRGSDA